MVIMRNKVRAAAVMVRPGKIELQEFPYPKIPANSALVKMEMSRICGTDKHMYKGETMHPGQIESTFPIIPGHENVGVIEEIGQEAKSLEVERKSLQPQDRVVPVCDVVCGECYVCRTKLRIHSIMRKRSRIWHNYQLQRSAPPLRWVVRIHVHFTESHVSKSARWST